MEERPYKIIVFHHVTNKLYDAGNVRPTRDSDIIWALPVSLNNVVINNDEVKAYVEAREANYRKAKDFLERGGYEADRSFFGSEDGEAILYRKRGAEDWHFLCHLDPLFVEIEDVEGYVKEEIQSLN